MTGAKATGEYDYIKPDKKSEYRKKVEPAGKYDSNFIIAGIALKEVFKDNDKDAEVTKKNTIMRISNALKREEVLSTDLLEGMSLRVQSNSEIER